MKKPKVVFLAGGGISLIWKESIGIHTVEYKDASFFDAASVSAKNGYARFMILQECGPAFLQEILGTVRARSKCKCREPGEKPPGKNLSQLYELRDQRKKDKKKYKYVCQVCQRFWIVTKQEKTVLSCKKAPQASFAYRRISLVLRSGGTAFDCVEHADCTVDASKIYYSFTSDGGQTTESSASHADFLQNGLGLPHEFQEWLPAIHDEIHSLHSFALVCHDNAER